MKLKAKFDAVIVKPLENQETMHGHIIVPDAGKELNIHGTVIAVGEEYLIGPEQMIMAEIED